MGTLVGLDLLGAVDADGAADAAKKAAPGLIDGFLSLFKSSQKPEDLENAPRDSLEPAQLIKLKRPLTDNEQKLVRAYREEHPEEQKKASGHADTGESVFVRKIVGPVRVWHAILGGAVAVGGGLYWKLSK